MTWVKHTVRFLLVTAGIVVLTSLGIDASQYLNGSQSALGILADRATESACPAGMSAVVRAGDDLCVDTYEVSVGSACPIQSPQHFTQTAENIEHAECAPVSQADAKPWVHVTYHQARELCASVGKRLPTNQEWYEAALGTREGSCVVDGESVAPAGSLDCRSGSGVHDAIGNVWEWVDAEVIDGFLEDSELPETGYVQNADTAGIAVTTAQQPSAVFGDDYFRSDVDGRYAMMRGGFFRSRSDAGLYAAHAAMELNFSGEAIGFRCVQ